MAPDVTLIAGGSGVALAYVHGATPVARALSCANRSTLASEIVRFSVVPAACIDIC